MRRAAVLLFLGSLCAGVSAFWTLGNLVSLGGNEIRHYKEYWTHAFGWLLLAAVLTAAFTLAARGRWRFTAGVLLVICAIATYFLIVLWPLASA